MRRDAKADLALPERREHPNESTCEACNGTGIDAPGHGLDPDWCHECGGSGVFCENVEAQIDEALPYWIERATLLEEIVRKMADLIDDACHSCETANEGCCEPEKCEYHRAAEEARACLEPSA